MNAEPRNCHTGGTSNKSASIEYSDDTIVAGFVHVRRLVTLGFPRTILTMPRDNAEERIAGRLEELRAIDERSIGDRQLLWIVYPIGNEADEELTLLQECFRAVQGETRDWIRSHAAVLIADPAADQSSAAVEICKILRNTQPNDRVFTAFEIDAPLGNRSFRFFRHRAAEKKGRSTVEEFTDPSRFGEYLQRVLDVLGTQDLSEVGKSKISRINDFGFMFYCFDEFIESYVK